MQMQETTLVIQNPDGSIQIGTQPKKKDKLIIHCYNCKAKLIYQPNIEILKCTNCGSMNKVPTAASQEFKSECCSSCKIVLKVNSSAKAMKCPRCGVITKL